MSDAIVYVDTSDIVEGKLDELKAAIPELAGFIDANVPTAISYGVFLSEDEATMSVVQVHPDSASLEYHMRVGGPAFARFKDLVRLLSIDVYGEPSAGLLQQLEAKTELLGGGTVTVHALAAGFERFGRGQSD